MLLTDARTRRESGCRGVRTVESAAIRGGEGTGMAPKLTIRVLAIAWVGAALAPCSADSGPKEVGGTLVGAGAGAAIGNAIGGSVGNRALGTITGAALG